MFLKNNGDGEGELVQFKTDNPWQCTSLKGTLDTNVSTDELDAITSDIQRQHLPMLEQFLFSTLLNSLFIKIHLIRPCRKPSSITNLLTGLTEGQILGATAPSVKHTITWGNSFHSCWRPTGYYEWSLPFFCSIEKLVYIVIGMHDVFKQSKIKKYE
ncbi:hypothetical protein T11_4753 [Trichinella zimbabwensis]|uniref:Uncharacterized protein n=1 Tax=Trichinella zimbabwensis TaxID=268475 RepID=A0A0V1HIG1_9BILA|nr:hypothetical protein T11_4753 [Trichinella zimbabwensis]